MEGIDQPRSLRNRRELVARTAMLREPHMLPLTRFLSICPQIRTVELVGIKAERAEHLVRMRVLFSSHPSPLVRAKYPERWAEIPNIWARAGANLP